MTGVRYLVLLALCAYLSASVGAQDLSGTIWIFSLGTPLQPYPDNTWTVIQGAAGSPLAVKIQRGAQPAAELHGSYDGHRIEVKVDQAASHGVYSGNLSAEGTSIDGVYKETRPAGEVSQPFRLTRLDSISQADSLKLTCIEPANDPRAVICKAFVKSGRRLKYSWSLDGEIQPAMTEEIRLARVAFGSHRITAIGFEPETQLLTPPETLTFVKKKPRSFDLPLLALAAALLGVAGAAGLWTRKKWVKSVEVEVDSPRDPRRKNPSPSGTRKSVPSLRGDGVDETLVEFRGGLSPEAEFRAPDPSPRLLLKRAESGVMVRAVFLGSNPAKARLELRDAGDTIEVKVLVEPIVLEIQVSVKKTGFAPREWTSRVGGLCGAAAGRVSSDGTPVLHAQCQASLRIDGGNWSPAVTAYSDHEGNFRFEMPPLITQILGVELPELRLEKTDLIALSREPLEELCAVQTEDKANHSAVLTLDSMSEAWLAALAEWSTQC